MAWVAKGTSPIKCAYCGATVRPRRYDPGKRAEKGKMRGWWLPKKYCSIQCCNADKIGKPKPPRNYKRVCEECGKGYRAAPGHEKRFCSTKCVANAMSKKFSGTGKGKYYDKHGYVLLAPTVRKGRGRARSGYQQPEHRAVMERLLGRKLTKYETVHHKDGIRDHNEPWNLELWSSRHGRGQRVADQFPKEPACGRASGILSFGI